MPTRLPDFYYTTKDLDAQPTKPWIKSPPPSFSQGEDVIFAILLYFEGQPLDPEKYVIDVIIKKNPYAQNILWHGLIGAGITAKYQNVPGYYQIWMPAAVSSYFLPGCYYMDIRIVEKVGEGPLAKDRTIRLYNTLFDLNLSAMSPNPKLRPIMKVETSYDPATGETTYTLTTVEPTVPYATDSVTATGLPELDG